MLLCGAILQISVIGVTNRFLVCFTVMPPFPHFIMLKKLPGLNIFSATFPLKGPKSGSIADG